MWACCGRLVLHFGRSSTVGISASLYGIGTVTCADQGACVCGERQLGHWKTCQWVYRMVAGDTMLFKGNNCHVGDFEVKACIMSSEVKSEMAMEMQVKCTIESNINSMFEIWFKDLSIISGD
ncbi:hypothetical protein ACOSQ3_031267 [Xanthoceras sorbifolium]